MDLSNLQPVEEIPEKCSEIIQEALATVLKYREIKKKLSFLTATEQQEMLIACDSFLLQIRHVQQKVTTIQNKQNEALGIIKRLLN